MWKHIEPHTLSLSDTLNVAAYLIGTRTHGPGLRAVVWVQGCSFHCPGCIAPEWQEQRTAEFVRIDNITQRILARPDISGLTFSGGEPMLQAAALASLVKRVRQVRNMDLIVFTGYTLGQLILLNDPAISRLLSQVDVLIDGQYIAALNDGRGLRGSTNQTVNRLTERGRGLTYDFENSSRKVEIHIKGGQYLLAGIPPASVLNVLEDM